MQVSIIYNIFWHHLGDQLVQYYQWWTCGIWNLSLEFLCFLKVCSWTSLWSTLPVAWIVGKHTRVYFTFLTYSFLLYFFVMYMFFLKWLIHGTVPPCYCIVVAFWCSVDLCTACVVVQWRRLCRVYRFFTVPGRNVQGPLMHAFKFQYQTLSITSFEHV